MGYADGEAAALSILRGLSAWGANNTSRGDWKILNSGKSRDYVVLRPSGFEREPMSLGHKTIVTTWSTVLEVHTILKDKTSITTLQSLIVDIVDQFDKYPHLNGTSGVYDVFIGTAGDPEERWVEGGVGSWLVWEFNLIWKEEKTQTPLE